MSAEEVKQQTGKAFSYAPADDRADLENDAGYLCCREFVMGGCKDYKLNKQKYPKLGFTVLTIMTQGFLFCRPPQKILFKMDKTRHTADISLRSINVDEFEIGYGGDNQLQTTEISNNEEYLWFKKIIVQNTIADTSSKTQINYIEMVDSQDKSYIIGKRKDTTNIESDKIYTIETIEERGRLLMTGILLNDFMIVGLQFVDLATQEVNTKNLLYVYQMTNHQALHLMHMEGTSEELYYAWKGDHIKYDEKYFGGLIGIEEDYVLQVIIRWVYSINRFVNNPVSIVLPDCLEIFEKCLDGDFALLHSVFAMNRFINHCIQTEFVSLGMKEHQAQWHHLFNPGKKPMRKFMVKLHKYLSALSSTMETCKGIIYITPSLDIYTLSSLLVDENVKWTKYHYFAIVTFVAQVCLFMMVVLSLDWDNFGLWWDDGISITASIIITLIVCNLVYQQIVNTKQFRDVFPERKWYWTNILGYF
eukprot:161497_1